MQQLGMGQAINQALREEMERDAAVFLAGEGVGVGIHASPMLPTAGLLDTFGPKRVRDTPVSEAAIAGLAVGAAEAGLRPVVEIMFAPFLTLASDMIVNHAAKLRYLSGGKSSFPLVVRVKAGAVNGCLNPTTPRSMTSDPWRRVAPRLTDKACRPCAQTSTRRPPAGP